MKSILITGCNRGLGLGLVQQITQLPKPPQHLIATCRNKDQAKELQKLASQYDYIHILEIDLLEFDKYEKFVEEVDGITQGEGLNVLFNNAGMLIRGDLSELVASDVIKVFNTNTLVPIMLTKAFVPLLEKAASRNKDKQGVNRAAVINMSSQLGSIEDNTGGGMYSYRCSKAALNAATKSMSIDLKDQGIIAIVIHPGWVLTDMGGPNAKLTVDDSTSKMLEFIMHLNDSHNGGFYRNEGQTLPW